MKIYDTVSQSRITFIDRRADSPRADLFKCTLHWQDDSTLLIAWADYIKVARIRARPRTSHSSASANLPPLLVEITAVFQMDCMIAGIVPHSTPATSLPFESHATPVLTSLLILAYSPPDTSFIHGNERTDDRAQQARKAAERPELRIISRAGEELTADAISLTDFHLWSCNDYVLTEIDSHSVDAVQGCKGKWYAVLSPRDIVVVKPRDRKDHITWLVERKRYEEALDEVERIQGTTDALGEDGQNEIDAVEIGQRYLDHLVGEGWSRGASVLEYH